ncbi:MAG TPA: metal-dependent hydrolase [Gemmatimonadales bacterium]|jgi:L-ascorbate metabolism protein UlaG (beta-lactamase superfamily)
MPKLTWLSHATFLLEHGDKRVIIDPFLTGNPKAAMQSRDVPKLDAVLLTHGHGDHIKDAVPLATRDKCVVVAATELAKFCAAKGAPSTHPLGIGGGHDFPFGRVQLVVALHGGTVDGDETGKFTTQAAGLIVTVGGVRIYHAGDTALTMDMQLLEGKVDVMLVPIGDNYTMGPEDAARAVAFVKPKTAIPMHFGTFPLIEVDPHRFVKAVGTTAKVVVMQIGDTLEL